MEKLLLINADEPEEVRVAVVEDGRLEELYVETAVDPTGKGNIYAGRVENVERGLHTIVIQDQPGCKVLNVHCYTGGCNTNVYGPTTVNVTVKANDPIWTKDIKVTCATGQ